MTNKSKVLGVSVIICCYNSARVLPETLQHLSKQETQQNLNWEVIIVNNNSTDNTSEVAKLLWESLGQPTQLRVVDQPEPGLSFAREKGFKEAAYEYMLLCDDDNWLQYDYVQLAYELMEANPLIGVLGGKGEAVFEGQKPEWFEKVKGQYATGPQALINGDVSNTKRYVFGAGAIVRYTAYNHIKTKGFTSLLTDRKGKELSSGGDNELCYAISITGYRIWYNDNLKFKHFLSKERLTWEYLTRLNKAFATTAFYLRAYTYYFSENTKPKNLIWLRDLRHLITFLPKITLEYFKQPKGSDEQKYQQIALNSHIQLIKIYLEKRNELDIAINKVGELAKRLKL